MSDTVDTQIKKRLWYRVAHESARAFQWGVGLTAGIVGVLLFLFYTLVFLPDKTRKEIERENERAQMQAQLADLEAALNREKQRYHDLIQEARGAVLEAEQHEMAMQQLAIGDAKDRERYTLKNVKITDIKPGWSDIGYTRRAFATGTVTNKGPENIAVLIVRVTIHNTNGAEQALEERVNQFAPLPLERYTKTGFQLDITDLVTPVWNGKVSIVPVTFERVDAEVQSVAFP
ncbi:MAG: hypothetical protein AMXMBFR84_37420 [Candidatus Hydrogenedentota bacterium]